MLEDEEEALGGMVEDGDNTADASSHSGEVDVSDDDLWASEAAEASLKWWCDDIRNFSRSLIID